MMGSTNRCCGGLAASERNYIRRFLAYWYAAAAGFSGEGMERNAKPGAPSRQGALRNSCAPSPASRASRRRMCSRRSQRMGTRCGNSCRKRRRFLCVARPRAWRPTSGKRSSIFSASAPAPPPPTARHGSRASSRATGILRTSGRLRRRLAPPRKRRVPRLCRRAASSSGL